VNGYCSLGFDRGRGEAALAGTPPGFSVRFGVAVAALREGRVAGGAAGRTGRDGKLTSSSAANEGNVFRCGFCRPRPHHIPPAEAPAKARSPITSQNGEVLDASGTLAALAAVD